MGLKIVSKLLQRGNIKVPFRAESGGKIDIPTSTTKTICKRLLSKMNNSIKYKIFKLDMSKDKGHLTRKKHSSVFKLSSEHSLSNNSSSPPRHATPPLERRTLATPMSDWISHVSGKQSDTPYTAAQETGPIDVGG